MTTSKETAFWAAVRSDPIVFLKMAFNTIYPGKELVMNWHIEAIVHRLETCVQGLLTRLIINLPPRNLKSFITSVAWPAFMLSIEPTVKIIVVSYSDELAKKLAADFRRLIESDWYKKVFTNVTFIKITETEVVTDKGGGRYATSVGGSLTGRGADFIIVDDPLKADDAFSETARKKVNEWYKNTLLSRLDDKKHSILIVVMQRLHVNDLTGYVENEGDWHKLSFPAIATKTEVIRLRHDDVYERAEGEALQEAHESLETLKYLRSRLGAFYFASQYQQSPATPDGGLFKRKYFQLVNRLPIPLDHPHGHLFLSIDTAASTSESADYSALSLVFAYDANYYVVHAHRGRWDYEQLTATVMRYVQRFNGEIIVIVEAAGIGISLYKTLQKQGVRCFNYDPRFDKMARAALALPILAEERLFVLNVPGKNGWVEPYINEFVNFPYGRHDDQVDSLSQLLPWAEGRVNPGGRIYFVGGQEPDPRGNARR